MSKMSSLVGLTTYKGSINEWNSTRNNNVAGALASLLYIFKDIN